MKTSVGEFNYSDAKMKRSWHHPILVWGSCEPHGEHLPYLTDSILAASIAYDSIMKTDIIDSFLILPAISYGSQNIGQTNKKFCIHMSSNTQYMILRDMVSSLLKQDIHDLIIINGHNGNNFKSIVRDIEQEFEYSFKIYVCNYLDVVDKETLRELTGKKLCYPDDHAGFTETSLMLHYLSDAVEMDLTTDDESKDFYGNAKSYKHFWSPRNWDDNSYMTRVGFAGEATAEDGEKIAEYITDELSKELKQIAYETNTKKNF